MASTDHLRIIFDVCEKADQAQQRLIKIMDEYDLNKHYSHKEDEEHTNAMQVHFFYQDLIEWLDIKFA